MKYLIVGVILTYWGGGVLSCNETAVEVCMDAYVAPWLLTRDDQKTVCDERQSITDCAEAELTGCSNTSYAYVNWNAVNGCYDYVCSDIGYKYNSGLSKCYDKEPAVGTGVDNCLSDLRHAQEDRHANCSMIEDFDACFCDVFQENCNKYYINDYGCEVSRRYFNPTAMEFDCGSLPTMEPLPDPYATFTAPSEPDAAPLSQGGVVQVMSLVAMATLLCQ